MAARDLFDLLDADGDGTLSREDLRRSACRLRWHWAEAPLYAVLDLLAVRTGLSRAAFVSCMSRIVRDPDGPYGQVLRLSPLFERPFPRTRSPTRGAGFEGARSGGAGGASESEVEAASWAPLLATIADPRTARRYEELLGQLAEPRAEVRARDAALLIIDPQRSFTGGVWRRSLGAGAEDEVAPIRAAFAKCGHFLRRHRGTAEVMFTRCPFPPDSYDWDEAVAGEIDEGQLYFVKPGNSVLWPILRSNYAGYKMLF